MATCCVKTVRERLFQRGLVEVGSRQKREAEFTKLAGECNITVGVDGHCERDALKCTEELCIGYWDNVNTLFLRLVSL